MEEQEYLGEAYGATRKVAPAVLAAPKPAAYNDSLPHDSLLDDSLLDEDLLEDQEPRAFRPPSRGRVLTFGGVVLVLLLLVTIPPLVNVNRFRREIASSISASLGRPVRLDAITLNLLPMPGFTLENFVVGEDPAFGAEPVIFANTVTVRLRVRSLWRRRVEFSRIALDSPSVNLVHLPDGRWNIESILLQASRMPAAPTAQKNAGDEPRFPYIEATGARLNIKQGLEKMPLSLTDAKFALWLPEPKQWRLRLDAHPTRTDSSPADTGLLHLEGTLGKAATFAAVPLDLSGEWSAAPLGAVSRVLMGRDAGLRGELDLKARVVGTAGANGIETRIRLAHVRREDFVPAQTLNADVGCTAQGRELFHRLESVHCAWPSNAEGTGLIVDAAVPNVFRPSSATGVAGVKDVPLAAMLDALRVASPGIAPDLNATGKLEGQIQAAAGGWSGGLTLLAAQLALRDAAPLLHANVDAGLTGGDLLVAPLSLDLGAATPATLEIRATSGGYTLHLSGTALRSHLDQLARALPQFGEGLESVLPTAAAATPVAPNELPLRLDLTSTRLWGGTQVWAIASPTVPKAGTPARRKRR